jgi:2-pyrone-4,6-dicarboxylate lactonase
LTRSIRSRVQKFKVGPNKIWETDNPYPPIESATFIQVQRTHKGYRLPSRRHRP